MCLCHLCSHRFLRAVHGTEIFLAYCHDRGLPVPADDSDTASGQWSAALSALPDDRRERIGSELAAVQELGGSEGIAHLLEAAGEAGAAPAGIPDGVPLALWFLLQHPGAFWEVYSHHEPQTPDPRYVGRAAAGLSVPDPGPRGDALAAALGTFFREHEGTGGYATARVYRLPDCLYAAACVAGRVRIEEGFDGHGEAEQWRLSVARRVTFAYYPRDGTILLRAPVRSPDLVRGLLDCFGRCVLGSPVEFPDVSFDLERLRPPFRPLPDAADMECVRLKALHLRYPGRAGRRRVALETLSGDAPGAVSDLLAAHGRDVAPVGSHIAHAVVQVRLRVAGRPKTYLVRLWPDRCDVGPGAVGDRLLACVRRWGI